MRSAPGASSAIHGALHLNGALSAEDLIKDYSATHYPFPTVATPPATRHVEPLGRGFELVRHGFVQGQAAAIDLFV